MVWAQYNCMHAQLIPEARKPKDLMTARAIFIRGGSSENGCHPLSQPKIVKDAAEDLTVHAAEAISDVSAGHVVNKEVIQERQNEAGDKGYCFLYDWIIDDCLACHTCGFQTRPANVSTSIICYQIVKI
jgi:hypothetical protein